MSKTSKGIISPILNITGSPLRNIMWYITVFLHIALIPIFLGIWSTVPSYVQIFSNWIHLIVGLYLVIRFRPYQTNVEYHNYDRALVFSAGLFMLEALLASSLMDSPWGKEITVYLETWGKWVKSLPFVAPFIPKSNNSNKKHSTALERNPDPNPTSSSLGGSSYSLTL
jgi:hypothetical protein